MSNLDSHNKLTEFPALSPEPDDPSEASSSIGKLSKGLTRFLWWRKTDPAPSNNCDTYSICSETSESICPTPIVGQIHHSQSCTEIPVLVPVPNSDGPGLVALSLPLSSGIESPENHHSSSSTLNVNNEGRNLPNVLRRISSLIATSGSSNSSDLKKYWMPDSVSKECYDCAEKFTTFRRKHHCRICGQIFCSRCCNQEIPGKIIGVGGFGDLRVCTYCCKIVLSYLNSADLGEDGEGLRLVQEDLQSRYGGAIGGDQGGGGGIGSPSVHFGPHGSDYMPTYRSLPRRKTSLVYSEERFIGGAGSGTNEQNGEAGSAGANSKAPRFIGDWVSIKSLWDDMILGLDWGISTGTSRPTASGSEIVDWLLARRKISLREQGVQVGQMLMDVNLIESVGGTGLGGPPQSGHEGHNIQFFDAYILYRPVRVQGSLGPLDEESGTRSNQSTSSRSSSVMDCSTDPGPAGGTPQRLPSTSSLYSLDINPSSNTATVSMSKSNAKLDPLDPYSTSTPPPNANSKSPTPNPKNLRKTNSNNKASTTTSSPTTDEFLRQITAGETGSGSNWHSLTPQQLTTDEEVMAFQSLVNSYVLHENELLAQLLSRRGLSSSWAEIILPIVHKVTETVRPDLRNADEMDIRQYVHFKKVPGGLKSDSRIINGIVCSKNVAHRRMKSKLKAPKILLLGASIDYHRFENRFQALEPLVMQEHDYLKNTVSRISSTLPDLLLVEKSVSRLAQEFLLDLGVTLVLNVKTSVMERVQRSTGGLIETSADSQITKPQLGLCHHFYVETYRSGSCKSKSLMFFDGCPMHLGCTVILRGGTEAELIKVKEVTKFMMFVAYNWRLERSLHIDMLAEPPIAGNLPAQKKLDQQQQQQLPSSASPVATAPIQISDFSDPLQSDSTPVKFEGDDDCLVVQVIADPAATTSESSEKIRHQSQTQSFAQALSNTILSASPFITYDVPYLETQEGNACALRSYFPKDIYWSPQFYKGSKGGSINQRSPALVSENQMEPDEPPHPFLIGKITKPIEDEIVQRLIADFRRKGGRLGFGSGYKADPMPVTTIPYGTETDSQVDVDIEVPGSNSKSRIDALDPFNHQRLSVLFYSFSPISSNAPYFCVSPWVVDMDMYRRDDISLGMFLERYCFRISYNCPARQCDMPMVSSHVRRFVHGTGAITVGLKEVEKPLFGGTSNTTLASQSSQQHVPIHLLSWCPQCKTMSKVVPLSPDAWSLSFAKYLELRFHGKGYKRRSNVGQLSCPHSLHHDNVQHFTQRNIIASFTYTPIRLWEILLPIRVLDIWNSPRPVPSLIEDCKSLAITGHNVYTTILELLVGLRESVLGNSNTTRVEEIIKSLREQLKVEQSVFRSKIEDIQMSLTGQNLNRSSGEVEQILWKISDGIGFLRNFISDTVQAWNLRFQDLLAFRKREEKQGMGKDKEKDKESSNKIISTALPTTGVLSDSNTESMSTTSSKVPSSDSLCLLAPNTGDISSDNSSSGTGTSTTTTGPELNSFPIEIGTIESSINHLSVGDEIPPILIPPTHNQPDKDKTDSKRTGGVKSLISHLMSGAGAAATGAGGPMVPFPWTSTEHHLQSGLCSLPIPIYENEPSSLVAFALCSHEYKKKRQDLLMTGKQQASEDRESENALLSVNLNNGRNSASEDFLSSISSNSAGAGMMTNSVGGTGTQVEENAHPQTTSTVSPHIEVHFSSGTTAKFYCRIYFAESFRQLRKMVLSSSGPGSGTTNFDEDFYIRSISRCIPWAARGGKSGSTFCKTADDRFIVKQMSKIETHSFLDFAPNYFQYLKGCYRQGCPKRPTLLSKIVGVYRIGIRSSGGGSGSGSSVSSSSGGSKCDILIMENLFYNRNICQKFDLKGSIRNRLASTTPSASSGPGGIDQDLVLLDENLVNMATENPLYVRPHTKRILRAGVENDSRFLSSQMVMDYSLLVGLDGDKGELVIGIIDYIRTFTWDKKIETLVKSSGILGGQGKTPTVISPEEYQARFCEAMDKYFLLVPDRWMGLGQMESNAIQREV